MGVAAPPQESVHQGAEPTRPVAIAESTAADGSAVPVRAPSLRKRSAGVRHGPFKVLLVGLYSARYAAIGESHGLSVIAGVLAAAPAGLVDDVRVLDMAAYGEEDPGRIIEAIDATRPDVVGIAVPYGAFTVLAQTWPRIQAAVAACRARVVFGGALPTYLAAEVLEIEPAAVVVNGEGERPMLELLAAWSNGGDLDVVQGVTFIRNGVVVSTSRTLTDLSWVPAPYRAHVPEIAASGGQIYAESSRACSWAACTFCLRGLTDIDGRPREHRRFPAPRLAADLRRLSALGIGHVVFADEDFLGADLAAVMAYLDALEPLVDRRCPRFEISTTINSVYDHDDDREANLARTRVLHRLRDLGLRKVFLGIESGSDSQLRRYAKGHTAEECAAAIYRVRAAGLRLEVGFIMFDPLCSIAEAAENVAFIRRTGIVDAISAVDNELRLQQGARYLRILERHERETGRKLYDRQVDVDTLSHRYEVVDGEVARLLAGLRPHTAALYKIFYPAKNISRHGENTPAAGEMRRVVSEFKAATLAAIGAGVEAVASGQDPKPAVEAAMFTAGSGLAAGMIAAHRALPGPQAQHPVLLRAVGECETYRRAPQAFVNR